MPTDCLAGQGGNPRDDSRASQILRATEGYVAGRAADVAEYPWELWSVGGNLCGVYPTLSALLSDTADLHWEEETA